MRRLGPAAWAMAVFLGALGGAALPRVESLRSPPGLPDGPAWGRSRFQASAANAVFATADGCAHCHSVSDRAGALWSATGEDVSPHGLWEATMMANAGRDPYWHAQLAKEREASPEKAAAIESLCVRCHMPTMHHTYAIAGLDAPRVHEGLADPLFADGVTCTVCHQVQPDGLGEPETFSGRPVIRAERRIFGPYEEPSGAPMQAHTAFTPEHGAHISSSAMCAACHTLSTTHVAAEMGGDAVPFEEQSPYLEWRNSVFSDEGAAGLTSESRSCQQCHMPDVGDMRIARNPGGRDFNIQTRPDVRGHAFVGGNAFMLDLFRAHREELGVTAPDSAFERLARATRAQLSHATARLTVANMQRITADDGGPLFTFDVQVENLTGHKFPTGYPARRAWLHVIVRDEQGRTVFESGKVDEEGRLIGVADEMAIPHYDVIERPSQVQVYEMVAADVSGAPTTYLTRMATRKKDNRLLPRGYAADGPHATQTGPIGVGSDWLGSDGDFVGGGDMVTYRVTLPEEGADAGREESGRGMTVIAWLLYQPIPPAWVAPLRDVKHEHAGRFVTMYDGAVANGARPEEVAVTVGIEERGTGEE